MPEQTASVVIDGTALYFRSREGRSERLDYEAFDRELRQGAARELGKPVAQFRPAMFLTTFDPQNDGQVKFLGFLRSRLAWEIETKPLWEADPLPKDAPWDRSERRSEFIRFDASIAFAVGRLVERRDLVIVCSDSFGLAAPLMAAAEYGDTRVVLAFFGHQLDPRWHGLLRDPSCRVQFWDLDDPIEPLFGREPAAARVHSPLSQLR